MKIKHVGLSIDTCFMTVFETLGWDIGKFQLVFVEFQAQKFVDIILENEDIKKILDKAQKAYHTLGTQISIENEDLQAHLELNNIFTKIHSLCIEFQEYVKN